MSTQGWAAAFQGLQSGLEKGLALAAQRRQQDLEDQRLELAKKSALQEGIIKKAALSKLGYDETGGVLPGWMREGETKDQADLRHKRMEEGVDLNPFVKGIEAQANPQQNNIGQGPTTAAASLGALANPKQEIPGLSDEKGNRTPLGKVYDIAKSIPGGVVDPKVLEMYKSFASKESGDDWLSKLIASNYISQGPGSPADKRFQQTESRLNQQQQIINEDRDAARKDREEQRQNQYSQKASEWVDKSGYNAVNNALVALNAETGVLGDKPDLSKLPGPATAIANSLNGTIGQIVSESYGGGRTNELLRQILDPELYKFSGSAVTAGEAARASIRRGIGSRDPSLVAQGIKDFYKAFSQDAAVKMSGNPQGFNTLRQSGTFVTPDEAMAGKQINTNPQIGGNAQQNGSVAKDVQAMAAQELARRRAAKVGK